MKRRELVIGIASCTMLASDSAVAQQRRRTAVVGFVNVGAPEHFVIELDALRRGLSERNFVEGKNVELEYHWLRDYGAVKAQAEDLVRRKVDVIIAPGNASIVLSIKPLTTEIPIVFANGGDPVRLGIVASMNRPGANITGVSFMSSELSAKRLQILSELLPAARRIGFLYNSGSANAASDVRAMQASAQSLRLTMIEQPASNEIELAEAFSRLSREHVEGLVVHGDVYFTTRRDAIIGLARQHKIAAIYGNRSYPASGGLVSYGDRRSESYRLLGQYVARILSGDRPADLPVLQPTLFELVINLKAAKALGIEVPPMLLARADEVIE